MKKRTSEIRTTTPKQKNKSQEKTSPEQQQKQDKTTTTSSPLSSNNRKILDNLARLIEASHTCAAVALIPERKATKKQTDEKTDDQLPYQLLITTNTLVEGTKQPTKDPVENLIEALKDKSCTKERAYGLYQKLAKPDTESIPNISVGIKNIINNLLKYVRNNPDWKNKTVKQIILDLENQKQEQQQKKEQEYLTYAAHNHLGEIFFVLDYADKLRKDFDKVFANQELREILRKSRTFFVSEAANSTEDQKKIEELKAEIKKMKKDPKKTQKDIKSLDNYVKKLKKQPHAEMRIINHLLNTVSKEKIRKLKTVSTEKMSLNEKKIQVLKQEGINNLYIGISKLPCLQCHFVLKSVNETAKDFVQYAEGSSRRTHNNFTTAANWILPAFLLKKPEPSPEESNTSLNKNMYKTRSPSLSPSNTTHPYSTQAMLKSSVESNKTPPHNSVTQTPRQKKNNSKQK